MSDSNQHFSVKKRLRSFGPAFRGFGILFKNEHNSRIHVSVALMVVVLGFLMEVSPVEWCLLIFAIGMVFITELINSAIENQIDMVVKDFNQKAGNAKDMAAAAVLMAAIASAVIGLIIFVPKVVILFKT
ncbi:MAG: diacylglycerol kinase family protein [Bacteroidia bacterium]|nr:diacylglycerol kinase family protein [Bacteroidia bacterium]